MFMLKRIIRNRKPLTNYICTSNIIRSDDGSKKPDDFLDEIRTMKTYKLGGEKDEKNVDSKSEIRSEGGKVEAFFSDIKKEMKTKSKLSKNFSKNTVASSMRKKGSGIKEEPPKVEFKTHLFKNIFALSAEKVAKEMGGNIKETKRELLDYIKTFEVSKEKQSEEFSEIFEEKDNSDEPKRSYLFRDSQRMNFFKTSETMSTENQVELTTWKALEAEDLEYQSLTPPKNYYEELIKWTKEGTLWHFPIDNDQGREKEGEVSFAEHIFLEQHLEPWCPKQGPIRKFMELVLIGLSKNPYLTVEEKKEHIAWFEQYFENKKKLLKELGALGGKQLKISNAEENS